MFGCRENKGTSIMYWMSFFLLLCAIQTSHCHPQYKSHFQGHSCPLVLVVHCYSMHLVAIPKPPPPLCFTLQFLIVCLLKLVNVHCLPPQFEKATNSAALNFHFSNVLCLKHIALTDFGMKHINFICSWYFGCTYDIKLDEKRYISKQIITQVVIAKSMFRATQTIYALLSLGQVLEFSKFVWF